MIVKKQPTITVYRNTKEVFVVKPTFFYGVILCTALIIGVMYINTKILLSESVATAQVQK